MEADAPDVLLSRLGRELDKTTETKLTCLGTSCYDGLSSQQCIQKVLLQ